MLRPVWDFPHGPPYCFRSFHAITRSKFRCVFFHCFFYQQAISSSPDSGEKIGVLNGMKIVVTSRT